MREISLDQPNQPRLVKKYVESTLLKDNRAGESANRHLTVYLPKQASEPGMKFPVLYCLAPWTSSGRMAFDWQPFRESLFDRLTRLIDQEQIPPCVVVSPDLYTSFGGSQYINSSFFGPHGDHLVHEVIPYVEENFPVLPGSDYRGVFGRSSGGFGALRLAMDYPGTFSSVACHSGDMGFDAVYRRDLIDLCNGLKSYNCEVQNFLDYCSNAKKLSGRQVHLLMLLGMCATYSPSVESMDGFDLPIDLKSGQIDEDIWRRWVSHDPVVVAESQKAQEGLKELKCLYIECGNRDQYNLQYGARQMHEVLNKRNISHYYFEFDDNHSGTSYRYDVSLPLMLSGMNLA